MTWFDPVKPYLPIVGLLFIIGIFVGGTFTGCQWQENRDNEKIDKAHSAVLYYKGQAEANALTLADVNKQYKANKQAALEWKERADQTARAAATEKKKNIEEQKKWAEEVDRLKKDPDCKAIMETKICSLKSF